VKGESKSLREEKRVLQLNKGISQRDKKKRKRKKKEKEKGKEKSALLEVLKEREVKGKGKERLPPLRNSKATSWETPLEFMNI